ncbi:DMT family transporter [Mesorhizobium sp. VNQ89]|uniref:DMT family transporter n=1 Tax=Mesorhizobium quangtriensis TaxID=3157709 RepID=UPI0032B87B81
MTSVSAAGRRESIDALAATLMVFLTFSWGLNGVAAKLTYTGYSPIFLALVRSLIGGFLVFLWCRWRRISLFERDGTLWAGIFAGTLFAVEFMLIFVGLEYTSVARSVLLINTMPFWTLIAGHFFFGERISLRKLVGLLLAFGGLVLIFSDKLSVPGPDALIGDLMNLAAGIAWAATIVVIRKSSLVRASAEKLLLYQLAVAVALAAVALPFFGPPIRDANMVATGALLFQSIYIVAFTYALWFWLVQRYPSAGLASFTFLTPVFGVLLGGIILGEPLGFTIFLALMLIVGGLMLVNRAPKKPVSIGQ